jgi:hypothetical protein
MITELRQPLPLETPRGDAWAHLVIDYGTEHHLLWVCFLCSDGTCWTFANPEIKIKPNPTLGIRLTTAPSSV